MSWDKHIAPPLTAETLRAAKRHLDEQAAQYDPRGDPYFIWEPRRETFVQACARAKEWRDREKPCPTQS